MRAVTARVLAGLTWALVLVVGVGLASAPAFAQGAAAATVSRLNKEALDAYDNLNFDQAKTLLEQALAQSEGAGLADDPVAARTHLNLGMLFIAGFQDRDQAVEHFKAALRIQPDITAPAGVFNPEVQAAFDEVKSQMHSAGPAVTAPLAGSPSRAKITPAPATAPSEDGAHEEDEEDEEQESGDARRGILLSVGIGSGAGVARGKLDANRDLDSDGNGTPDNNWQGGLAPSRLGHLTVAAGYFLSPRLMLSLEGRLQVVTGTTVVKGDPRGSTCIPSCSAPAIGLAVFAKGHWFMGDGPLRPFVNGGIGAGSIRQVVKLTIRSTTGQPAPQTGCGESQTETCVDTVTGGPFWLAAGGGLAYEIGSVTLLGSLTANVGIPNFMFNVDALFGFGLRL